MISVQKKAKVIAHGGRNWLVGGNWSAGGRFARRGNIVHHTVEESFPPERSSAVWLREEKQIGWFVFDDHPYPGVSLASAVLGHMRVGEMPWRGIFRLDDGWWFIAVDITGAVHPRWDIWLADDEKDEFFRRHATEIAAFTHEIALLSADESWAWLMEHAGTASFPVARPVLSERRKARQGALMAAGLALVGFVVIKGVALWNHHEIEQARRTAALMAQKAAAAQQASKALAAERQSALMRRVNAYWKTIGQPWKHWASWDGAVTACRDQIDGAVDTVAIGGWMLTGLTCTVNGTVLSVVKTWKRVGLATVLDRPHGVLSGNGDIVHSNAIVTLLPSEPAPLPQPGRIYTDWVGWSQQWRGVLDIAAPDPKPYRPPVPPFVAPAERKQVHPPILWYSTEVTIAGHALPAAPLWPVLRTNGFVPAKIVATMHGGISWEMIGTQYANP